ncbi:hypothetical protein [Nocardia sp. CA-290969]|uniref:hypothetical protein n=1 Tax=Nocardia sp. CA-290969 TaxID=3239986 RepID=UPI003D8F77C1
MSKLARSLADQIRTQAAIAARPGQAVVLERIADQVAELEAAQRPPLGYVVGFVTSAHGLTFAKDYGGPNLTRAAAEQELAHEAEENPGVEFKLLELREARS